MKETWIEFLEAGCFCEFLRPFGAIKYGINASDNKILSSVIINIKNIYSN